jgi:hypothetical protein
MNIFIVYLPEVETERLRQPGYLSTVAGEELPCLGTFPVLHIAYITYLLFYSQVDGLSVIETDGQNLVICPSTRSMSSMNLDTPHINGLHVPGHL